MSGPPPDRAALERLYRAEYPRTVHLARLLTGDHHRADRGAGQFEVSDQRSSQEVAAMLARHGLEPVWKDWDGAFLGTDRPEAGGRRL